MAQAARRRFTTEEAGELIELASRLDDLAGGDRGEALTYDQVIAVAEELGIGEEAVARAIADTANRRRQADRAAQKRVRRRLRFIRHAIAYVVVVGALVVVDALGGGGWWFFYVAAIWGVVLALHGLRFVTRRRGPLERSLLRRETARADQSNLTRSPSGEA